MSDLVKRLRAKSNHPEIEYAEAASSIEQLEREIAEAKRHSDIQRVNAMEEANWKPAGQYWRDRADKAEAALAAMTENAKALCESAEDAKAYSKRLAEDNGGLEECDVCIRVDYESAVARIAAHKKLMEAK